MTSIASLVNEEESVYSAVSDYDADATVSFDILQAAREEAREEARAELLVVKEEMATVQNKLVVAQEELEKAQKLLSLHIKRERAYFNMLGTVRFVMNIILSVMGIKSFQ